MNQQNQQTDFRTSDAFLATSLYHYGIELCDVEIENGRGVFVFKAPNNGLIDFISAGKMVTNVANWFGAYKVLMRRLGDKKREAGLWRDS